MKPLRKSIKIWNGCATEIAAAVRRLEADCTDSHRMGSRRWPLTKLLELHVVSAVKRYLDAHEAGLYDSLFQISKSKTKFAGLAAAIKKNAVWLDRNIDLEIQSRESRPEWTTELQATFETLRELIFFCRTRVGTRGVDDALLKLRGKERKSQRGAGMHTPYCELCWQLSTFEAAGGETAANSAEQSKRFCAHHDPRDNSSRYRTDHRHRAAFHSTLNAIYSQWDEWHEIMGNMREEEVRRWAFEYIRNLPTKLHLNTLTLKSFGLTNTEIAAELNVSRAAITKIIKSPVDYRCVFRLRNFPVKPAGRKGSGAANMR